MYPVWCKSILDEFLCTGEIPQARCGLIRVDRFYHQVVAISPAEVEWRSIDLKMRSIR